MSKLTIDEVIEHCNRVCDNTEKIARARGHKLEDIESKQFWEHYNVREWLEELKQYKELEEQGLLLRIPFKINQPVWICGNKLICDYVIKRFIVTEYGVETVQISKEINYWNTFYTEQWLVSVFPSKEEAEQALERMKGE